MCKHYRYIVSLPVAVHCGSEETTGNTTSLEVDGVDSDKLQEI